MSLTAKRQMYGGKPKWLKRRLPSTPDYSKLAGMLHERHLHTVCQEAKCPNQWECFSTGTATFLILGSGCTRNCRFCAIKSGPDGPPNQEEPKQVAEAASQMGLQYVVVTSVTRDDLPDGGAGHFAATIRELKKLIPGVLIEVLIPDFKGAKTPLNTVLQAKPDVLNHNLETVPRLYARARPEANYSRSLQLLHQAKSLAPELPTKSGIMLGLGEKEEEVHQTLQDLLQAECSLLTLGQYLQPSKEHLPVARFIPPREFEAWRDKALKMGFTEVASGPFVRSSYKAHELFNQVHG